MASSLKDYNKEKKTNNNSTQARINSNNDNNIFGIMEVTSENGRYLAELATFGTYSTAFEAMKKYKADSNNPVSKVVNSPLGGLLVDQFLLGSNCTLDMISNAAIKKLKNAGIVESTTVVTQYFKTQMRNVINQERFRTISRELKKPYFDKIINSTNTYIVKK